MSEQLIIAAILGALFCGGFIVSRLIDISKSLDRIADAAEDCAKAQNKIALSVHFMESRRRG